MPNCTCLSNTSQSICECSYRIRRIANTRNIWHFVFSVLHFGMCNLNMARTAQGPLLGRSWGPLGSFLGALGARLALPRSLFGPLGAPLGVSGVVLGSSWGVLQRYWVALGCSWGAQGVSFAVSGRTWDIRPRACHLRLKSKRPKTKYPIPHLRAKT